MTKLLHEAFQEAEKLSEQEQNALAEWLLEELESEQRWDKAFKRSSSLLERLAGEALVEHHSERTQELNPEKL
ncbi:hypothetical protein HY229_03245 [Candidatus Acetothermia bacterium]|nr:hypothetical protein [Candidatus Acetothermia bacterium]MBI3643098.1 hypothetical protein [Candidatus Acetothermia bacterium]